MNKDNAKDFLPLVQALAEGKQIQIRRTARMRYEWHDTATISDGESPSRYRIKPEPRNPREWTVLLAMASGSIYHCPKCATPEYDGSCKRIRVREIIEE